MFLCGVRFVFLCLYAVGPVDVFYVGVVIVERIFSCGIQPWGEVYLHCVVSESPPAFVHVGVLVVDVVGVERLRSRIDVVDVSLGIAPECFQVVQRHVVGDVEQLVHFPAFAVDRPVGGFCPAERHFGVHAQIFVHLHAASQVYVYLAETLIVEHAPAFGTAERCTVVGVLGRFSYGHVVCLREACVEIVFQFVSVFLVLQRLSQPSGVVMSVEQSAEAGLACLVKHALCALSVFVLHFEGGCHACPCEVARIGHSEAFVFHSFLGGDEYHSVSCSRTVECGGVRSFEHRYGFYVIGVYVHRASSSVHSAEERCVGAAVVIERHSVYYPQRLVVVCQR